MKNRNIKKRINNQGISYLNGKSKIIIGCAFIFVAFALTTIVIFNQSSYAADNTTDKAPSEITMYRKHKKEGDTDIRDYVGVKCDSDTTCGFTEQEQSQETYANYLHLPVMFDSKDTDTRKPLFCIESGVDLSYDATENGYSSAKYDYDGLVTDYGIIYILNKSLYYGGNGIVVSDFGDDDQNFYKETYGTQAALWLYLYNTRYNNESYTFEDKNNHKITSYSYKKLTKGNQYKTFTEEVFTPTSGNDFNPKIKKIVEDAEAYDKKMKSTNPIKISVSGNIFEIEGTDYYQTDKINVVGADEMESFSISAKGVDDLFFVDKDGKKIEDTSNILPGKELYIRFPKSSIKEKKHKIDIVVTGSFKGLLAYKYKREVEDNTGDEPTVKKAQLLVLGTTNKRSISKGTSIDVIGAPNTGKTKNYIIIILGTLVLIGGVALIIKNKNRIMN